MVRAGVIVRYGQGLFLNTEKPSVAVTTGIFGRYRLLCRRSGITSVEASLCWDSDTGWYCRTIMLFKLTVMCAAAADVLRDIVPQAEAASSAMPRFR